ncbi:hypothetical protein AAWM_02777 [Aspergillus awamori]|uniref:Uncharacterized protein n=1 Tax=Aspergillus awamori TaxID=105351 RepID=A0A401KL68_ASPAW|nr:hypothetical protein AAWM_02777 [Aspergillus awamori]GKZ62504.1 hypothetical protein AnigIFM49718_009923 [Aspergillus niger]GKZ67915.1 hypothetical protein AnigIFM50267_002470 [Aspergillus niger]GLA13884.1 hypothetical protein AnigIFM62618_011301 [Aspergillus niger]
MSISTPYLNGLINGYSGRRLPMYLADLEEGDWNGNWDLASACAEARWQVERQLNPDVPADCCAGAIVYRGLHIRLIPVVNGQALEPFESEGAVEWVSESQEFEDAFDTFIDALAQVD